MGYARKDVEKTKKIAKKFVRYQEGAELYSMPSLPTSTALRIWRSMMKRRSEP